MSTERDETQRAELGVRLRDAREYLGFSQEEVASKLRLSRTAVTHIESGARKVEAIELEKLAELYGRSVTYFLSGKDESNAAAEKVVFAARALQGLSAGDMEQVIRFANYLRSTAKNSPRKDR